MVANTEHQLRMFVVHAGFQGGIYIALVPADLTPELVDAALHELGVDGDAMLELGGWKTPSQNVAVAHVPFPEVE